MLGRERWLRAIEEADECGLLNTDNGIKVVMEEEGLLPMLQAALRHMGARVRNGEILLTYALDHMRNLARRGNSDEWLLEEYKWWARAFCALHRASTLEEANAVLDLLLQGELEEAEALVR